MRCPRFSHWFLVAYALVISTACGAPFVPPADGPVPFRRDRVPLEPHTISGLSKHLLTMVDAMDADTAQKRRTVAQMLAVAKALDPGSESANKLLEAIPERDFKAEGDAGEAAKRYRSVWQMVQWLETPEAGIDGQALAACLKDVMVVVDPEHARVAALRELGEQAAWASWVPPQSEYESRRKEQGSEESVARHEDDKPNEPVKPDEPATIRLNEAKLIAILWKREKREGPDVWVPVLETLQMKAYIKNWNDSDDEESEENETNKPLHVSVGSWGDNEDLKPVAERTEGLIKNRYHKLPDNLVIEIRNEHLDSSISSNERHALSGVCALLANAAISGEVPDAIVLGVMDEDSQFGLSVDYWSLMQALSGAEGLRLIVPAEAEGILSTYLAMERPDFFLKNEVMMAKTIDDILELGAKSPMPPLDGVYAKFREIRDKQGTQDARIYVGNSFIRQRLMALSQEEPRHLSAKMLAVQAAGNRPTKVVRAVSASELRRVMKAVQWVRDREYFAPGNRDVAKVYEECRTGIDTVTKLAGKDAQPLIDEATLVANAVRDFDRSARSKRGEYWEIEEDMRSKKRALDREYDRFDELLKKVLDEKT